MPMQFGKVTVESPQEVLARLQQERRAMSASGNVAAINQATTSNALDALFGNPEVKSATALQSRMKNAQAAVVAQEGDDDVTTEMRRISAMRDAIQDLDPGLANEMTSQLLQLGTVKAERSKLMAQTAQAQERAGLARDKNQREGITFGMGIADKAMEMEAAAGKGINYWRRKGNRIEHTALPEQDSLERRKMLADGWLEGTGPTSEAEASSIVNPTKAVQTDLQTSYLQGQQQLDSLATIAQKFDASFLTLPTKVGMKMAQWVDQLGGGKAIPADVAGRLEQYTEFRANSVDAFNRYIKFITGAQMAVAEAQRIQKGFADVENDGPTQFLAKMRGTARQILGVQRRSAQAIQSGLQITAEQQKTCAEGTGPCVWDSIQVPSVSEAEVDQFLGRFGIPPRAAKAGAPDASGFVTTKSGARVREIK